MFRTRIAGTGSYLPEKTLSNFDLEKMVETSHDWILERTGISSRHIASDIQNTSDLAYLASIQALEAANLNVDDIDLILLATASGDQVMPTTSCVLQDKLKAKNAGALDISAACSGFVYGMTIANSFIASGLYKNILVVGAEILSRYVNYKDRNTCILFGDGAGAMVLQRADETQDSLFYSSNLAADGSLGHLLSYPAGGTKIPFSEKVLKENLHYIQMEGREIFKNAVRTMSTSCQKVLDIAQIKEEEISWLIPHQANSRIIEAVAKFFKIHTDKVIININTTGNTSSATIPIAFDEAVRDGRIQRGQNLLTTAFGAGLTSGSILIKY